MNIRGKKQICAIVQYGYSVVSTQVGLQSIFYGICNDIHFIQSIFIIFTVDFQCILELNVLLLFKRGLKHGLLLLL